MISANYAPPAQYQACPIASASQLATELIREFEGLSYTQHYDSDGLPAVGYGHKLTAASFPAGVTLAEAEELLAYDLFRAETVVDSSVRVALTGSQRAALASFVFNVGHSAFLKSTLRRKLNEGDYAGASAEFARWTKANGQVLPGLVLRRLKEQALFNCS